MCGFVGEFLFKPGRANVQLISAAAAELRHRGPDEDGSFLSADQRLAVGFRRLAVIDLDGSHQPMSTPDGLVTVAFNGEIYNFRALRRELEAAGGVFQTYGDTEVLLHLYRRDGVEMLQRLAGMFALAIYDARAGRLMLARDRFGQKPLWYCLLEDRIIFASEAKGLLLAHPAVPRRPDRQALTYYLTLGYIPAPLSAWAGIRKLQAGQFLLADRQAHAPQAYWQPEPARLSGAREDIRRQVRHELGAAVEAHMVSDVPLGAFLSGGLDSAIVVSLMAKAAGRVGGVKTFTAGFQDAQFDERAEARAVARHCGTEHTELLVTAKAEDMVDRVVDMYDEPFGDSSAIPTWLICRAARQHVTVALVGDGGDEVFGGYDRYRALHLAETMSNGRYALIRLAAALAGPLAGSHERGRLRRLIRFANVLPYPPPQQYFAMRALFGPDDLRRLLTEEFIHGIDLLQPQEWFCNVYERGEYGDEVVRAQRHDMATYLPDDLLVKTDIASMASSMELRAPMLDHHVCAIGLGLPAEMKVSKRFGKIILREAFADLLPAGTLQGRKRGFAVPLSRWLRQDLRGLLKETLLGGGLDRLGVFRRGALEGLVNDHLLGRDDHAHRLWALLVLGRWVGRFGI